MSVDLGGATIEKCDLADSARIRYTFLDLMIDKGIRLVPNLTMQRPIVRQAGLR